MISLPFFHNKFGNVEKSHLIRGGIFVFAGQMRVICGNIVEKNPPQEGLSSMDLKKESEFCTSVKSLRAVRGWYEKYQNSVECLEKEAYNEDRDTECYSKRKERGGNGD